MELSKNAKERFCKDCSIPINIFDEPYFTDRLKLLDKFYGTIDKWNIFIEELKKYSREQDYFEEYNRVKDVAIMSIQDSEAYQLFNSEDMNKYKITHNNLPSKDIFKPTNDGHTFISIDMKKANFSSLKHYDSRFFDGVNTWEEFIGKFTDNKHIINSKYIRQVVLGNCNPKRHITYEKYLMDNILSFLLGTYTTIDKIVFFSNDEVVIDVTTLEKSEQKNLASKIRSSMNNMEVPLRTELFTLHKIGNTSGYIKAIIGVDDIKIELKCLNSYMMPFVIRRLLGEEVIDSDKIFYSEGLLSQFIEMPEINISDKLKKISF